MPRWVKHVLMILAVLSLAACTGSSGCEGMKPLPAGFDADSRIQNAGSVRITESGLNLIEDNIPTLATTLLGSDPDAEDGVITFPIERVDIDQGYGTSFTVCKDGPDAANDTCIAEINLADAVIDLSTAQPNSVIGSGTVPLRLKILPIEGSVVYIPGLSVDGALSGGGNNDCNPDTMSFADIPVEADIAVEVETNPEHSSRVGYSRLTIKSVTIDEEALTSALHFCGGGLDDAALNSLKGLVGGMLIGGFTDTLVETMNDMLCMTPDETKTPACPNGSTEEDGKCMYQDGSCVSMMLGLDGNVDLSGLLASISPGTRGALDFLLAAGGQGTRDDDPSAHWGDLNPVANGATLGMFGGVLPSPVSNCVTPVQLEIPTGIPQPDEIHGNTLPGWDGEGPHVGFAISERFLNYAMGAAYNSGALCLGVSTEQIDLLSTGMFALLVPSIKFLTFQKQAAPLAISVRPQKPPEVVLGDGTDIETDPFVRLKLDEAMIDFYVWSSDRFIRIFTAQFDLDVPMNLTVSEEGITPVLENIYVNNPKVTNAGLLKEDPATIAEALAGVVEGLAGDFLGEMSAFQVSDMLSGFGLTVDLRQEGIRHLSKGSDAFLGVFAGLEIAPQPTSLRSETTAEVVGKTLRREGFRLTTANRQNRPRAIVRVASSLDYGSHSVEYTYKLDRGLWHPWQTEPEIVVDDAYLMMQGVHTVAVKSRVVGRPETEDRTPARLELRIDVDPPALDLASRRDGSVAIDAWDLVSPRSSLTARYRFDDGTTSDWVPLDDLSRVPARAASNYVTVQVRDEEGNVASKSQGLIRGRPDKTIGEGAEAACGCSVPGSGGSRSLAGMALCGLGLIGLSLRRRRRSRRRAATPVGAACSIMVLAIAGSFTGCSCSDDTESKDDGDQDAGTGCGSEGMDPCVVLEPGLVGSYTSAAVAPDGTIWVAGYNEADWEGNVSYGDLVVGTWNGTSVDWEAVDGVPDEEADDTIYDTESWRGGLDVAGPDVGQWTSTQVDDAGNPRVAYWDLTNKALKFAAYDGASWAVSTVFQDANAEAGRYAKMLLIDGSPVIAFQVIELADNGFATSKVVLAHASSPVPGGSGDWTFEDLAVDAETPCRDRFCAGSQKCFLESQQCAERTSDCDPKCASGTGCLNGACLDLLDGTKVDAYPDAIGGYISIARSPSGDLGVVFYDRIHGNLMQARQEAGAWVTAILDGQTDDDPPVDTGDVGIGAALAIDEAGDWHIAYVDGFDETLKYMHLSDNGREIVGIEVADDGAGTDAGGFDDGRHIVGDDANITVSPGGDVRIAYQDATVGTLRWTVGVPASGDTHDWSRKVIEQSGFGGFFPQQIMVDASTQIVNWWRVGGDKTEGDVRVLSPL